MKVGGVSITANAMQMLLSRFSFPLSRGRRVELAAAELVVLLFRAALCLGALTPVMLVWIWGVCGVRKGERWER